RGVRYRAVRGAHRGSVARDAGMLHPACPARRAKARARGTPADGVLKAVPARGRSGHRRRSSSPVRPRGSRSRPADVAAMGRAGRGAAPGQRLVARWMPSAGPMPDSLVFFFRLVAAALTFAALALVLGLVGVGATLAFTTLALAAFAFVLGLVR